jgi:hypothetical protein
VKRIAIWPAALFGLTVTALAQFPDVPPAIVGTWRKSNGEVIEFFQNRAVRFTDSAKRSFTGVFWCLDEHLMRLELQPTIGAGFYSLLGEYTLSSDELLLRTSPHHGVNNIPAKNQDSPYRRASAEGQGARGAIVSGTVKSIGVSDWVQCAASSDTGQTGTATTKVNGVVVEECRTRLVRTDYTESKTGFATDGVKWKDKERGIVALRYTRLTTPYGTLIDMFAIYPDDVVRVYIPEYDASGHEIGAQVDRLFGGTDSFLSQHLDQLIGLRSHDLQYDAEKRVVGYAWSIDGSTLTGTAQIEWVYSEYKWVRLSNDPHDNRVLERKRTTFVKGKPVSSLFQTIDPVSGDLLLITKAPSDRTKMR